MVALSTDWSTLTYDRDMNDFGLWLANEIDKRDWKQADLARELHVNTGVISSWVNGQRRPSYESCLSIARALTIDPEIVVAKAGRETTTLRRPRSFDDILRELDAERPVAVPIIEQIASAGRGEPAIGYVYLPPMGRRRPGLFAMRVRGQCMSPRIEDGDTIIVDREQPAEIGKIVLAVAGDNWDVVLVKKLVERDGRRWLQPLQGKAIPVDETVTIVGVVKQIISEA